MKKIFLAIAVTVLVSGILQAQDREMMGYKPHSYYSFSWNISIPAGDFNKWVSIASPAGGMFSGQFILHKNIGFGFDIGWNNYYEKFDRQTYYGDNGTALTAAHYRYAYMLPFKADVSYYFLPSNIFCPYIRVGIGGDYMEQHLIVQDVDIYDTNWGFLMSPEVGAFIKFGPYSNWGADFRAKYWFNTNSFSFGEKKFDMMQGIDFSIGLAYLVR
jgi:hypothetical protein